MITILSCLSLYVQYFLYHHRNISEEEIPNSLHSEGIYFMSYIFFSLLEYNLQAV